MKNVIIYTRVSTEEQGEHGYSLASQLERLQKYCKYKDYNIIGHYEDECSGQDFDRPDYIRAMDYIKKNKNNVDMFLCTVWDRFARDVLEALINLKKFKKYDVEVNCIEQYIDFSIPESLYQLNIFLTNGEVEVKKLSKRVKDGMLKARKEGCRMGSAPFGYDRDRDIFDNATLKANNDAPKVLRAFELIAKGNISAKVVMKEIGYPKGRSAFYAMLKNKVYIGKIKIAEDKTVYYVDGLHKGIIDEPLFYKVQDVISGRRMNKTTAKYSKIREDLYLRGYLVCPSCGNLLTGSPIKGHGGEYCYYYCKKPGHKAHINTTVVHDAFESLLGQFKPKPSILKLYGEILKDISNERKGSFVEKANKIQTEINACQVKVETLENKWLDGKIEDAQYHTIHERLEKNLVDLNEKKQTVLAIDTNFNDKLNYGLSLLYNLDKYFVDADINLKNDILGLTFNGKMMFHEKKFQTLELNEVFSLIIQNDKQIERNLKRHTSKNADVSCSVTPPGFKPGTF